MSARAKPVLLAGLGVAALVLFCSGQAGDYHDTVRPGVGDRTTVKAVLSGTVLGRARLREGGSQRILRLAVTGQQVEAGQALAVVETRFGLSVAARSPVAGTVVRVDIAPGNRISVGDALCVVED